VQYAACDARIEPQSVDAIAARLLKDYRGTSITLLSPLIIARKGLYYRIGQMGRGKGFAHLASGRNCCQRPVAAARSIYRTQHRPAHSRNEDQVRQASRTARETRHSFAAWGGVVARANSTRSRLRRRRSFQPAGLSKMRHRISGTGIRFIFVQFKARCESGCFGTGLQRRQFDRRAKRRRVRVARDADQPPEICPECAGGA